MAVFLGVGGCGYLLSAPRPVWCKACRHAKDADLAALITTGRGDVPLVQMKWRCGNCGSRLTEFIVGGSHMRPR
jgi:hypothetical protein